jgi:hypothetical protein
MSAEALTGGCVCGAVRYTWTPSIKFKSYACHCTDCQKRSGSSFSLQQLALEADFAVEGDMIEGGFTQPSGARALLFACPKCHSRIYGANDTRPGVLIIRAGTFDHNKSISPDVHVWVRSKQPWIALPPEAKVMDTQPDTADGWTQLVMPEPL